MTMKEIANKIQAVLNTLEQLNIPATYDNARKLAGCYQVLIDVRNELNGQEDRGEQDAT